MTDPTTGIHEPMVVIPIGMDCRASPLAIAIEKMGRVFMKAIPHMYDRSNCQTIKAEASTLRVELR